MAIESGFYDSYNNDRVYYSSHFSKALEGVLCDGVFPNIGNVFNMDFYAYRKMRVYTGKAWIKGHWVENTSTALLNLSEISTTGNKRADTIYLEVDNSIDGRIATLKVYEGTETSGTPEPYIVPSTENKYVLNLGYVIVGDSLATSSIHSWIGTNICPFVNYLATEGQVSEAMMHITEELENLKDDLDNLFFKNGDSIDISWRGSGYVTNSRKNIIFSVPLPKAIPEGIILKLHPTSSLNEGTVELKAIQNGNYINYEGASSYDIILARNYNPSWNSSNKGFITFTLPNPANEAWPNSINNDTCGIIVNFVLYAFSQT